MTACDTGRMSWFAPDPELEPTEEGLRFLTALRERAEEDGGWPCDPEDTYATYAVFQHRTELLVTLELYDPSSPEHHLLTVGAFFTGGGRLAGGEFHDQLYTLEQHPETLIEASGAAPEALAERAAEWFRRMLELPVLRHDFEVDGRVVNQQWVLADSARELTARFRVEPGDPLARTVQVRGGSAPVGDGAGQVHERGDGRVG